MRVVVTVLTVALAGVLLGAGCDRLEQGEKCDAANGNEDCASGLVCLRAKELAVSSAGDRCCRPTVNESDDPACRRPPVVEEDDSCVYDSDCKEGYACRPPGECVGQCRQTQDCPYGSGLVCVNELCVADTGGTGGTSGTGGAGGAGGAGEGLSATGGGGALPPGP